jgi:tetratricopeptide (TPR) repeat protein
MRKKVILPLAALLILGTNAQAADLTAPATPAVGIDTKTMYYPQATVPNGISKYKKGNYTGCLQEMLSVLKKDPSNAVANYYLGLSYMKIDDKTAASEAFDKVIAKSSNIALLQYAARAKNCLNAAEACKPSPEEQELDNLVNSSYGNANNYGVKPPAPAVSKDNKQKELDIIKQKMNSKEYLDQKDIQLIRSINSKSEENTDNRLAAVSDEEVLNAIRTLKDAGVNVSVNTSGSGPDPQMMQMAQQMQMLNGNSNNNNAMMNMLPYMYSQNDNGKNIDPQVIQSLMMNSMMPDFGYDNK